MHAASTLSTADRDILVLGVTETTGGAAALYFLPGGSYFGAFSHRIAFPDEEEFLGLACEQTKVGSDTCDIVVMTRANNELKLRIYDGATVLLADAPAVEYVLSGIPDALPVVNTSRMSTSTADGFVTALASRGGVGLFRWDPPESPSCWWADVEDPRPPAVSMIETRTPPMTGREDLVFSLAPGDQALRRHVADSAPEPGEDACRKLTQKLDDVSLFAPSPVRWTAELTEMLAITERRDAMPELFGIEIVNGSSVITRRAATALPGQRKLGLEGQEKDVITLGGRFAGDAEAYVVIAPEQVTAFGTLEGDPLVYTQAAFLAMDRFETAVAALGRFSEGLEAREDLVLVSAGGVTRCITRDGGVTAPCPTGP